ncbi:MBL fold metallo-hydrolase [Syntrophus buswellii]|uniref:MBL fold metallo-hydrolase n=1 Tax=Syntrophus buswellii TaxID=43774 RepID=UPI0009D53979|nr:MAG: ribonuclease Z [Syntrophus sp. PtaB.Bin138]
MKITIVYDNETQRKELKPDWGFSCIVDVEGRRILFDTGANGSILLGNMEKIGVNPTSLDEIFISHDHWDHTGALADVLRARGGKIKVYVPASFSSVPGAGEFVKVGPALEIHQNIYSTGELKNIEQSMIVKTEKGLVVLTGCSHPGVGEILKTATRCGKVSALIGGLHGFREFGLLRTLDIVCPTHCTLYKSEIEAIFPEKFIQGGVGKVIDW